MEILHCPYSYFPSISGAELYIQKISEFLVKRNYKVKVLCTNALDFQAFRSPNGKFINDMYDTINDVKVNRFDIEFSKFINFSKLILDFEIKKMLKNIKFLNLKLIDVIKFLQNGPFSPNLFKELLLQNGDLIHSTAIPYFNLITALIAGKLKKIPTICTPFYHFENKRYHQPAYTRILDEFDRILVCSKAEKKYLVDNKVKSDKIKQIHMAVDLRKYERAKAKWFLDYYNISGPKILFCGYKNEEKGALSLLNCLKYVASEFPNVSFIFIGPSTKAFNIKKRKLGNLRKNIVNIGVLPYDATLKRGAFAVCDLYAMPSRSEAFGIAYLEAWASKKAVIGADIQASIIKDKHDGLVVPFDAHPKILAKKIIQLIKDEDLRIQLGLNGYNKIKDNNWTWDHLTTKIETIYKEVLH